MQFVAALVHCPVTWGIGVTDALHGRTVAARRQLAAEIVAIDTISTEIELRHGEPQQSRGEVDVTGQTDITSPRSRVAGNPHNEGNVHQDATHVWPMRGIPFLRAHLVELFAVVRGEDDDRVVEEP